MVQTIWNGMVQYSFNFHTNYKIFKLFLEYICVFEYMYIAFFSTNILQSLTLWNEMKYIYIYILPRLYSNIICKNVVKIFENFEMGYTQTCTSLESNIMQHPKGVIVVCFHPFVTCEVLPMLKFMYLEQDFAIIRISKLNVVHISYLDAWISFNYMQQMIYCATWRRRH
jgi:hypothetical protein